MHLSTTNNEGTVLHCWYHLTFSVYSLKLQVFAGAGVLFSLNNHCRTVFSLSGEKDVDLIGQCCCVWPLKLKTLC
jgi:hypothetical protein